MYSEYIEYIYSWGNYYKSDESNRETETNMKINTMEAWKIFMKLCEEFPELYDKYVEKVEKEMKNYKPDLRITGEDKERVWKNLQEMIEKES